MGGALLQAWAGLAAMPGSLIVISALLLVSSPPGWAMPLSNRAAKSDRMPVPPAPDSLKPSARPASISAAPLPAPARAAAQPEAPPGEILWSNGAGPSTPATTAAIGARSATGRINATERTIALSVPLRDGPFYLGDIGARLAPDDAVSLPKDRLVQMLAPLLRAPVLDTVKGLPDTDGHLELSAIQAAGLDLRFDAAKVELAVDPKVEQRMTGKLSMSRSSQQVDSEALAAPAALAGYLNLRGTADYAASGYDTPDGLAGGRVAFDGAMRWRDVVLESAATFDAGDGVTRGPSRLVYDLPESAVRVSAGDVAPMKAELQGGADLLGVSIEKSYEKLQPGANIRPTGSRSFRIDRPSQVEVRVKGHVVRRLQLRPGEYDLSDLPLSAGANEVSLLIEDDTGQKRTLDFTVFSGRGLLAPGISEWSLSAGVASRYSAAGLPGLHNLYSAQGYDFDTPVVSGFYERGLTPDLTGALHLQADPDVVMGGGGAGLQTSFGVLALDLALSHSVLETLGFAAGIGYELANLEGADGVSRSFRVAIDYRSEDFAAVGLPDPHHRSMADISAVYAQDLPWEVTGSVSGNYSLGSGVYSDRYGVDVSLARSFGAALSAGVSLGYEQALSDAREGGPADGFTAAIQLGYRLSSAASLDARHDMRDRRSHLGWRHHHGQGVGSWDAQLELERAVAGSGDRPEYAVSGSAGYVANRGELSVSHHAALASPGSSRLEQRSAVTAGTAIAFADGAFAVGRPVANGFAIVAPHHSIRDSGVTAGSSQAKQAGTDALGPALISDIPAYAPARLSYDVDSLPIGYDLGAGAFDLRPAYRSGYSLTVGSDYTVTAYGALVDAAGEPLALITGSAREDGGDGGRAVTVFTNRAGKFGAQGLRPGRWLLEMATEPPTRFVLDIPKDAVGLVKFDQLRPEAAP